MWLALYSWLYKKCFSDIWWKLHHLTRHFSVLTNTSRTDMTLMLKLNLMLKLYLMQSGANEAVSQSSTGVFVRITCREHAVEQSSESEGLHPLLLNLLAVAVLYCRTEVWIVLGMWRHKRPVSLRDVETAWIGFQPNLSRIFNISPDFTTLSRSYFFPHFLFILGYSLPLFSHVCVYKSQSYCKLLQKNLSENIKLEHSLSLNTKYFW